MTKNTETKLQLTEEVLQAISGGGGPSRVEVDIAKSGLDAAQLHLGKAKEALASIGTEKPVYGNDNAAFSAAKTHSDRAVNALSFLVPKPPSPTPTLTRSLSSHL